MNIVDQKNILKRRLAGYKKDLKERSEKYRQRKQAFSIPRSIRALRKIANGTYTECDECGGEIGHARLVAVPAALLCITCQIVFE